jgi:LacI family transcriptional regulator
MRDPDPRSGMPPGHSAWVRPASGRAGAFSTFATRRRRRYDGGMAFYPHVVLIVETSKQYDRGVLRGIGRYIKRNGPWSVFVEERGSEDPVPSWLAKWKGDGIIARIKDRAMADTLLSTGVPIVELRQQVIGLNLPTVYCNDAAIGALGMSHLKERGLREFAYCGRPGVRWSDLREQAYKHSLKEAGHACHVFVGDHKNRNLTWDEEQGDVARWLESLPKPIGILTCNDIRGLQVLDACRRIDLPVPERVAVLGVDNDEVLCELSDPSLSSIDQDVERIGYEAASVLDRLMSGGKPPRAPVLVEPVGVVDRLSTNMVAIDDPAVANALRFIRQHACDHIRIEQLADRTGLSRRMLQRRFKALTGRTLKEEILNTQLARVKSMLAETDLKLDTIAQKCGFHYIGYLCSFFKMKTGMSPGEYRKMHALN